MKYIVISVLMLVSMFTGLVVMNNPVMAVDSEYQLSWPGILPDHPLYKVKVFRNKVIAKMLITSVKRVEFDLLMADKTLYAAKLLFDRGSNELAKETALKGENYFSMLVSDYGTVLAKKQTLPQSLHDKILSAYTAHQQLIAFLYDRATPEDKKTYDQVDYFSKSNYQSFLDLDKPIKAVEE